jgi:carbamoyl-phosphate synthase small subunit
VTVTSKLYLETGEIFEGGSPFNLPGTYFGEVVFNTGMVGYIEAMTDPSYTKQILVFTYPLIGNYGVPDPSFWESNKIQVKAIVVSELCEFPFHHRNQKSLLEVCKQYGVPVLTGIDTRKLAIELREHGVTPGAITIGEQAPPAHFIDINAENLVAQVSISKPEIIGSGPKKIIAVDCGIKHNILRLLQKDFLTIKQVPYDYDYSNEEYDGLFISNGPGAPERCEKTIEQLKKAFDRKKPIFGICLGAQLMALAAGATTYKLPFGHRAQNHPCLEVATSKCFLSSQNHGYAVKSETLPTDWETTYIDLNDQSIQGIAHKTLPFFAVQFHPEAAPGPVDAGFLFQKFFDLL